MIHSHAKAGDAETAQAWLRKMIENGCHPDHITYVTLLGVCSRTSRGFDPKEFSTQTYGTILKAYAEAGNVSCMKRWLSDMTHAGLTASEELYEEIMHICRRRSDPGNNSLEKKVQNLLDGHMQSNWTQKPVHHDPIIYNHRMSPKVQHEYIQPSHRGNHMVSPKFQSESTQLSKLGGRNGAMRGRQHRVDAWYGMPTSELLSGPSHPSTRHKPSAPTQHAENHTAGGAMMPIHRTRLSTYLPADEIPDVHAVPYPDTIPNFLSASSVTEGNFYIEHMSF